MFPTSLAAQPKLPKDAAVLDPNPNWAEIHRVIKMVANKRFEQGPGTLGINTPSYMNYRIFSACDLEFNSRVEPTPVDDIAGKRCPLCWTVESAAA